MRSIRVGYPEHAAAIELQLHTDLDFEALTRAHGVDGVKAFTVCSFEPGRADADATIIAPANLWQWETFTHELTHAALHVAHMFGLKTTGDAEHVPHIVGEFVAAVIDTHFEPTGGRV